MALDRSADRIAPRRRRPSVYSRFVRLMKLALPTMAVLVLGVVLAWPQLKSQVDRLGLDFSQLGLLSGNPSTIINPRYFGVDEQDQPYSMTAAKAAQRDDDSGLIDLTEVNGDIELGDGRWVSVRSDTGVYNRDEEYVDLTGDVVMYRDDGVEFYTEAARYDLSTREGQGEVPIAGQWSNGGIASEDGFKMFDGGDIILFKGQARLTLIDAGGRITP